jgi:hypothetical protein
MGFIGRAVAPAPISTNDVPDLPASKITSGTFATGRISEASVTQHAQSVDLQPVKSDITALALREATNESSASFNLPNQHIDTFATDTLGTKTTTGVDDSGFVSSIYLGSASLIDFTSIDGSGTDVKYKTSGNLDSSGYMNNTSFTNMSDNSGMVTNMDTHYQLNNNWSGVASMVYATAVPRDSTDRTTHYIIYDFGATYHFGGVWYIGKQNGYGDMRKFKFQSSTDDSSYTNIDMSGVTTTSTSYSGASISSGSKGGGTVGSASSDGSFILAEHTGIYYSSANTMANFPATNMRYLKIFLMNQYTGTANVNAGWTFNITKRATVTSATGTIIQNTNTVGSAKTKVGGTILYKDLSGTATLGTDLKVYFTCNGGTNWTEASSYSAITPVYSTGVKQVRLGETTCTSGTDVRYKVEWANQASGSKETQLHGIGTNY